MQRNMVKGIIRANCLDFLLYSVIPNLIKSQFKCCFVCCHTVSGTYVENEWSSDTLLLASVYAGLTHATVQPMHIACSCLHVCALQLEAKPDLPYGPPPSYTESVCLPFRTSNPGPVSPSCPPLPQ